ncbi:integrase core domain-containing protein, partial [Bittarella massiliensis (ex Durand et al. 2017)]|uniref:integrase core domain-containing protein n=1 Tax=Bittarella massiliensis (ex Durand et al. 2017) TaxID=1720313 RepID=UPI001AA1081D
AALAEAIAQQRERSFRTYGYRRMWLLAMKQQKKAVAAELQLHSDQGFQYTSRAYFNLTKSYGITPSMSRRGNPYDNAMAENFFSILKTECIYRHKPAAFSEANEMMDRYILFYNH